MKTYYRVNWDAETVETIDMTEEEFASFQYDDDYSFSEPFHSLQDAAALLADVILETEES